MLNVLHNKLVLWLLAILAIVTLLAAPAAVPSAHADPVCIPAPNCDGG